MKNGFIKAVILSSLLIPFASNSFAQTWPCAQYITRQVPNGSAYETNISYIYDLALIPVTVTVAKTDTLLNASAIYNGNIWAWKQYTGTAQSGSGGARLIKVNYNGLDSTVTPTLTGYSFPTITMASNAAFIDPNGIYYVINTATSGASNFVLSRINLTTATPTLLSNLTVNLPSGSTVGSGGLGDLVYRNDSVFALVNNVGLFRFALPSTSTTSVSPNLVGSSINRTIGSLFAINSDLNNIYGYGSANGGTTQDMLLEISTQTGTVTQLTTTGVSVSQSDGAGCPSTNFNQPVFLNISGNVFDDANGLTDNTVSGTGTDAGGTLYAQLLDATNAVEETIPVSSNGTYTFTGLTPGAYTVLINDSSIASASTTLPTNWVNTGEYIGAGAGSDGNINGKSATVTLTLTNVANVDFGIEQLPTANNVTASNQSNPGGTVKVTVPTLNGSDPEQGILPGTGNLDTVIINTLSSNGTLYYNNVAIPAGDTIKNYNPSLLTVSPNSGAVTVTFTYSEIDAALESSSPATVTMPFTLVSINGNVFDDANGLTDNTVNGIGTNAGGLNAILVNTRTGKVSAATAIAANGTYTFSGIDTGNYNIEITTNAATIGLTPPAITLPTGWVSTGENLGTSAGSDGTINSILPLGTISANVSNADFGIEQLPVSDNKTYNIIAPVINSAITLDGTGSGTAPGPLSGSDPEDGILGTGQTVVITTVPVNSLLYYNGIVITNNTTINNYNPSLLQIKFTETGILSTSFQYKFVDVAGNQSTTPATYLISWASALPVVLTSFSAEKENDYSILKWTTSSELNVKAFNVERSTNNGASWEPVGEVVATGNSSVTENYTFTDDNPENGTNLYRLQVEDNDGKVTYSSIAQIEIESESSMTVYPNPVGEDEALNIQLVGLKTGSYKISMVSSSGQTVKEMTFTITNSGSALLVIPTGNLSRGSYVVIVNGNDQQYSKTVIVENR